MGDDESGTMNQRSQLETLGNWVIGKMCGVNLGHEDGFTDCMIGSHWMSEKGNGILGQDQNDSLVHFSRAAATGTVHSAAEDLLDWPRMAISSSASQATRDNQLKKSVLSVLKCSCTRLCACCERGRRGEGPMSMYVL